MMFWLDEVRVQLGSWLIRLGMAIVPSDVRDMARGMMLYHVPGVLSESRKSEIRLAKATAQR
jgi:hypothetical protein